MADSYLSGIPIVFYSFVEMSTLRASQQAAKAISVVSAPVSAPVVGSSLGQCGDSERETLPSNGFACRPRPLKGVFIDHDR